MADSAMVERRSHLRFNRGVFACCKIPKGTEIATFDGAIYHEDDSEYPWEVDNYVVQIGAKQWQDSAGIARYLNHSCDPNCGIHGLNTITTMRDIEADEELCWDYAMCEDGIWDMACHCATDRCRGTMAGFRNLSAETKVRYRGWISTWLVEKYQL